MSLVVLVLMVKVSEEEKSPDFPTVINAFELIGMSSFLDLSGLFETEVTVQSCPHVLCFKMYFLLMIKFFFVHCFRKYQTGR